MNSIGPQRRSVILLDEDEPAVRELAAAVLRERGLDVLAFGAAEPALAVLGDPSLASPTSDEGKSAVAAFQKDMAKSAAAAKAGDSRQAAILLFDAVNQPNTFDKVSPARQQRWLDNANSVGPLFAGGGPAPVSCAERGAIKVPVMVMGGALSRASSRYPDEALLRCLPPGTESFWVPDAHHIWPAENPEAGGPDPAAEPTVFERGAADPAVRAALAAPFVRGVREWLRFPSYEVTPLPNGERRVIIRDARFAIGNRPGFGVIAIVDLGADLVPRPGPRLTD